MGFFLKSPIYQFYRQTDVCLCSLMAEYINVPSSLPTDDAWAFAKWNAIQAVGVMSFGEFVCIELLLILYISRTLLVVLYVTTRQEKKIVQ